MSLARKEEGPPVWECRECDVRWSGPPGLVCWICEQDASVVHHDGILLPKGITDEL